MRELVETITIKDCVVQTFRAGGKGGSNQNKRDTGVRVIHPPSGAVGECREERKQLQNKRKAFLRMAKSRAFQAWIRRLDPEKPVTISTERVRTYNLIDNYVKDHRTGHRTDQVQAVLDGDFAVLYKNKPV